MIQDIAPHIYHNTYLPRAPRDGDRVLLCRPGGVFLREQPAAYPEALRLSPDGAHLRYLFAIDETAFYLWEGDLPALEAFPADEGWGWRGTEIFRFLEPRWLGFAGVTGYRLWVWYGSNRFCGRCGKPLHHHDTLRALTCPNCENLIFPTISPSVIVAVTHGDRLLLTRRFAQQLPILRPGGRLYRDRRKPGGDGPPRSIRRNRPSGQKSALLQKPAVAVFGRYSGRIFLRTRRQQPDHAGAGRAQRSRVAHPGRDPRPERSFQPDKRNDRCFLPPSAPIKSFIVVS